ncbi:MAG: hypothetical protein WA364_16750 [Candidatus Nitrosopolaris sp.]
MAACINTVICSALVSIVSILYSYFYLTTITGQCAWVTIPGAVLPNNNLLNPDLPLVHTTIKSTFSRSAYCIKLSVMEIGLTITCVFR